MTSASRTSFRWAAAGTPDPFFPIQGTPVEKLVSDTRKQVREIVRGKSDRLLVIIGPCSIHDPAAAVAYAEKLLTERKKHEGDWKW